MRALPLGVDTRSARRETRRQQPPYPLGATNLIAEVDNCRAIRRLVQHLGTDLPPYGWFGGGQEHVNDRTMHATTGHAVIVPECSAEFAKRRGSPPTVRSATANALNCRGGRQGQVPGSAGPAHRARTRSSQPVRVWPWLRLALRWPQPRACLSVVAWG